MELIVMNRLIKKISTNLMTTSYLLEKTFLLQNGNSKNEFIALGIRNHLELFVKTVKE